MTVSAKSIVSPCANPLMPPRKVADLIECEGRALASEFYRTRGVRPTPDRPEQTGGAAQFKCGALVDRELGADVGVWRGPNRKRWVEHHVTALNGDGTAGEAVRLAFQHQSAGICNAGQRADRKVADQGQRRSATDADRPLVGPCRSTERGGAAAGKLNQSTVVEAGTRGHRTQTVTIADADGSSVAVRHSRGARGWARTRGCEEVQFKGPAGHAGDDLPEIVEARPR